MASLFRRHSRGRPPHPDVLTPAEWRVLGEIREGRSNPEIAERLGLSRNTVKSHVSNMLTKLGLRDRSDLAVWQGDPGVARARRSPLLAPFGWLTVTSAGAIAATAIAVVLVGAFVVGLESGLVVDSVPDTPPSTVATEPPDEPTSSAPAMSPTPTGTLPLFDQLTLGDAIEFPEGVALYVWEGCTSCDGPAQALRRFERVDSEIEVEVLFERSVGSPYILSGWVEGSELYVFECSTGSCGGGIADASDDASVTLYRSDDDGATWESLGAQPITPGLSAADVDPADWGITTTEVAASDVVSGVFHASGVSVDLAALDPRGVASGASPAYQILPPVAIAPNGDMAVRWYALTSPSFPSHYLTRFAADGTPIVTYANVPDGPWFWLDDDRLIGRIWYQNTRPLQIPDMREAWLPTVIDLRAGTAHPIMDPFGSEPLNRNTVMGVRVR